MEVFKTFGLFALTALIIFSLLSLHHLAFGTRAKGRQTITGNQRGMTVKQVKALEQ